MPEYDSHHNPEFDTPARGEKELVEAIRVEIEKLLFMLVDLREASLIPDGINFSDNKDGRGDIIFPLRLLQREDILPAGILSAAEPVLLISVETQRQHKALSIMVDDNECSAFSMLLDADDEPVAAITEGNELIDIEAYFELTEAVHDFIDGYISSFGQK